MADELTRPVEAYKNAGFLKSADARPIRILAEYLEPVSRLHKYRIKDTIVFYGSARAISMDEAQKQYSEIVNREDFNSKENENDRIALSGAKSMIKLAEYYENARELARRLTQWSLSLQSGQRFIICSGGGPGMMEAANRGAKEAGGISIGMNISILREQYPNAYITPELSFEFHYFFMRKFWFMYLAKALVVMPGGFGTMDELFEVLTLIQTKKLQKVIPIVLFGSEYWKDVIHFEKYLEWGTIENSDLSLFTFVDTVDEAYNYLVRELTTRFAEQRKFWYL
ncbi:putative lysine decarboxylase [bacterium BMS3Abin05]|nr:putative lysine decarboxylase [bacterium BMS3Abin05]GBE26783.1 putative lysine decarboxylase [bacterium BMS3Bbin03]HDZ11253.1 TIGR00730 family Rossman fold protein [Bacteroidota bacterium]